VIVTYQPDRTRLLQVVQAVRVATEHVVIVDNRSDYFDEAALRAAHPGLMLKRLHTNMGIAAAQNEGVDFARCCGASYVLFLDQDSIPQERMVSCLRTTLERLEREGQKVACVGPRVRLPGTHKVSDFARPGWLLRRRVPCPHATAAVECDFLISSGSLVSLRTMDQVGPLEEGLFIDQVDTEWCLRARAAGYRVFGACGAVLDHRLGDSANRLWFGRWRRLPRHQAFRYYYIFRNTLLLFRRRYVSLKWMLFQLRWLCALFLLYGIFNRHRSGELSMMVKGVADGIRGVTGKLQHPVVRHG
jgi:rhamnosyltransferase